ncbi:outer membrane efflux protein [Arcobacter nitrofigilis DSM 7299]|uniref:Outer membrane efflux protein n=1 Tax=Arcobacter nitrofigilis (strain ATCC 33309 / DSM 7299 / CCUG 15893 / LMG 7604 / NCTC 12251 / CI) TaxID=572480 RepID=D5V6B2_ARCNC|nr:TolC family protein [Arcobacter nitrofigilis]ADG94182.1 outer membrane efflux protein [Arcobacter nitrofigilis DSM 7299]
MKNLFIFIMTSSFFLIELNAVSLKDTVSKVLINNPNVQSELENQKGYSKYVDDREGNYLPKVNLETYLETSKDNKDRKSSSTDGQWTKQDGFLGTVILKQYLYDGGITPSQVAQSKYEDLSNRYRSFDAIESTVLEAVKVYTDLVKSDERLRVTKNMVKLNEDNMTMAKENEKISGEILETYQVSSKLNLVKNKYVDEEDKKDTAIASYIRYVGIKPKGKMCRPVIDETKIPKTLEEAIKRAVLDNSKIKEQIEKIKAQREKIVQAKGKFLPELNLELRASLDKNIDLLGDGTTKNVAARLNFNWNLYNGNKDKVATEQERIFLNEQKKNLDDITGEIVSNVKSLYGKNEKYKERIADVEKYVKANTNIVDIYKEQFSAGTRTFIDILNAQDELFESVKTLIDLEYNRIVNYYQLMYNFSSLTDNILESKNQNCEEVKPRVIEFAVDKQNKSTQEDLNSLISNSDSSIIESFNLSKEKDEQKTVDTKKIIKTQDMIDKNKDLVEKKSKIDNALLSAPKNNFIINLATFSALKRARDFVLDNNLSDKAFIYEFGKDKKYTKILYGNYKTYNDAEEDMKTLSKNVLANKPLIDKVNKHQKLYLKYN